MGPISDHQLMICPAFYTAFCDLDGPYTVYVPGYEKVTRTTEVKSAKVYIMSFACPMTKLVNLQIIETKTADGILDGLTRFGCENGFPNFLILDQESSFMKAVRDAEVDLKDLDLRCFRERGVRCIVSPVAGHNFSGLIERKIRSVQDCFEKIGLKNKRLHATGMQTMAKLVETQMNNLPLGFSYGRDADNTPILKLVTPNLMRVGRIHSRVVDGPLRFPTGPKDIMEKVEQSFDAFYKIWNVSVVPKLIPQPKWFKDSPELKPEDVVYFRKTEGEFDTKWTVGQVETVTRSKDGVVRRAQIRYHNHNEKVPRFTDRAVQSLVRIFNIEDDYFITDMAKYEKLVSTIEKNSVDDDKKVEPLKLVRTKGIGGEFEVRKAVNTAKKSCKCCCEGHCKWNVHNAAGRVIGVNLAAKVDLTMDLRSFEYPFIFERDLLDPQCTQDEHIKSTLVIERDEIYEYLTALETNFDLVNE